MSPSDFPGRRRRARNHDDSPHQRSPSPALASDKRRSGYNSTIHSHRPRRRDSDSSSSPPPAKRRRTISEPRSRSPSRSPSRAPSSPRRHRRHEERSPSPYRRPEHRRDDRVKRSSRSPYSKGKKSRRRHDSRSTSRNSARRASHRAYTTSTSPPPRYKERKERRQRDSTSRSRSRDRDRNGDRNGERDRDRNRDRRSRKPLPSQEVAFHGERDPESGAIDKPIEKQKPNFKPTGLLAKEANTVAGTKIVLKYNEPPEARKPPASQKWQLYVFKGVDIVDEVRLYTQSCWLLGREAAVADLHVEHPSASKQHAVVQFRHSVRVNEFGEKRDIVRPYVIDLESANGTLLNGEKIKDSRYYEIRDKDVLKIGLSEREYVFMLPP